jgi:iron complex outermembrane recepter protein
VGVHVCPITESFDPGVKGNIPQEVPEKTASLWTEYHTEFNPDLSFIFGVSHESFTYGDPENTVQQPGFTIYEAGAHYELNQWNFSLTGSNITNEHYFNSCWNGNYCARSEPRLISCRVAYKW